MRQPGRLESASEGAFFPEVSRRLSHAPLLLFLPQTQQRCGYLKLFSPWSAGDTLFVSNSSTVTSSKSLYQAQECLYRLMGLGPLPRPASVVVVPYRGPHIPAWRLFLYSSLTVVSLALAQWFSSTSLGFTCQILTFWLITVAKLALQSSNEIIL